jgi:dTMP kinase
MDRPLLAAVLGIDGSGKTTQLRRLRGHLIKRGLHVELFRVTSPSREQAHRIAWAHGKENAYQLFDLNALTLCGALEYLNQLLPKMWGDPGRCSLLFDKYADSFKATAASRGLQDFSQVDLVFAEYPRPDVKIYLKIELDLVVERLLRREAGLYENENKEQLARYKEHFDQIIAQDREALVLAGELPVEELHQRIVEIVEETLVRRRS